MKLSCTGKAYSLRTVTGQCHFFGVTEGFWSEVWRGQGVVLRVGAGGGIGPFVHFRFILEIYFCHKP